MGQTQRRFLRDILYSDIPFVTISDNIPDFLPCITYDYAYFIDSDRGQRLNARSQRLHGHGHALSLSRDGSIPTPRPGTAAGAVTHLLHLGRCDDDVSQNHSVDGLPAPSRRRRLPG